MTTLQSALHPIACLGCPTCGHRTIATPPAVESLAAAFRVAAALDAEASAGIAGAMLSARGTDAQRVAAGLDFARGEYEYGNGPRERAWLHASRTLAHLAADLGISDY